LTIILSEGDVESLTRMDDVVASVEEAFRREGLGEVTNSMRTRSKGQGSVLSVMHANLSYLGRGGLKAYMVTKSGTRFVVVLFDAKDSTPLAVMGADVLGRLRTGAASGVATKHMYGTNSATLALMGSGKQALTQVLAIQSVLPLEGVRVWSPDPRHRDLLASRLVGLGFKAAAFGSPDSALDGAQLASAITSSADPFLTEKNLVSSSHVNVCGGNAPERAEMTAAAVGSFDTVAVDDLAQARVEYGDLIRAERAMAFKWDDAVELAKIVAGKIRPKGRTLFKSGGAALEDVAVASMVYDKAKASGRYPEVELG
jgi:alanine dehydrogenase